MLQRKWSRLPESELVVRAQRGERGAFEEIYSRFSARIYALLFGIVGSAEDAADLCQEVFLRAFRRLDTLRADQALYGWLRATATHLAIDLLRRGKLATFEPLEGNDPGSPREMESRAESPERTVIREETRTAVVNAVVNLKEAHRTVVALHHFEGLSVEEVAETLDIPVGTVKSRLARARESLRLMLAPYVEGRNAVQ